MSKELTGDLGKDFSKLVDSSFVKYLGCFIEKIKRGDSICYRWNETTHDDLESAKSAVQTAYDILQHSINSK